MRALVTGGAGFIGSHLVDRLLKDGDFVVCVDDLSLGKMEHIEKHLENAKFVFVECDVSDRAGLEPVFAKYSVDTVFHLAANSDIQAGMNDPEIDLRRTFLTTFTVLTCMKEYGVKKIVFASTSAIYGMQEGQIREDAGPLFPISSYGAAKLASEAYISAFVESSGMQAWIFRFPNIIGERLTHGVIYDFMRKLESNPRELVVLGDGRQEKPYMYVGDLIHGIMFVMSKANDRLNYFNLGVFDVTSVAEIARIVIEEMGVEDVSIKYTGGSKGWQGDVPRFQYDLEKVTKLGWRASLVSNEAVRYTVKVLCSTSQTLLTI